VHSVIKPAGEQYTQTCITVHVKNMDLWNSVSGGVQKNLVLPSVVLPLIKTVFTLLP